MRAGSVAGILGCALAACAIGACASGDGLLIEVDVADGVDPASIGAIDVWIGEPDANTAGRFIRMPRPEDAQAVDAWPFQILIVPDDRPRMIWAGAFGFADTGAIGGAPVAVGSIAGPVDVVPGELRYATITLEPYAAPDADCLFRPGVDGDPGQVIVPPDADAPQLDCDDDLDPADCNDLDPDISHGAPELCDGVDNDCDGVCDSGLDADGDHWNRCVYADCRAVACTDGSVPPPGLLGGCDCDDADASANLDGVELTTACDGVDNDCDPATGGVVTNPMDVPGNHLDDDCDGVCDTDDDGDLIATGPELDPLAPGTWATTCDTILADCRDDDPETYPNALETCDGVDNDCDVDNVIATGTCFVPDVGECMPGTRTCVDLEGQGWGACVLDGGAGPVPDELCAAYQQYQDAPWLERALYDTAGDDTARETCTLEAWRRGAGLGVHTNQLCAIRPRTRLHSRLATASPCKSWIAGGASHGGYSVELQPRPSGQPGASVASCDVDLVVTAVDGVDAANVRLPSIWVVVAQEKSDMGGGPDAVELIPVEIRVHYADASTAFACPARAFDCD